MKKSRLFSQDRQGRWSGVLGGREGLGCAELTAASGTVGSPWVRVRKDKQIKGMLWWSCCRPSSRDDDTADLSFEKL